ncbi:MAG TPA: TIGR01777 family oxidoreductase, partial [Pyrinomonadaceae bacterium]|nr:TIGR01777 family oxidoreductase [Pyrinomonadaceae bacterium]
ASAVGFYGADRGETLLDEESEPGKDFLADVCRKWEASCEPARAAGVRTVNLRIGVVLSEDGGALAKMLPPFRLGAGGRIGDGRQWMSWVALDDVVGIIRHALADETLDGPVNTVAPRAARNEEFTKTLGRVLGRPTLLPVPAFAVKLMFGEMGEALLLGSAHVAPERLSEAGYKFRHPELEGALRHALGK